MGVDITHIVRHEFYNVENRDSAMRFVRDTIRSIKRNLSLDESEDAFDICIGRYDDNEIRFTDPLFGWTFILHNGFWEIESGYHYCQIAMKYDGVFRLRESAFDITRALGRDEMWYTEDWYTSNGGPTEDYDCTFERLIDFIHKEYGNPIPEYDPNGFIWKDNDCLIPDYEPVYHDLFRQCKEKLDEKIRKFEPYGYRPIELTDTWGYSRCVRISDNTVHYIHPATFKPLVDGVADEYDNSFGGGVLIVKKQGKYAAYNMKEGCRISEYVAQPFRKEWSEKACCDVLINEEAGIRLYID